MRLFLAAVALPALLAAQTNHKLLVIEIDGLDARLLNDPALHVKVPNIRRLMRGGAVASVIGIPPSDTWPPHASLVTGLPPRQSGIANAESLWDLVTKSGRKAAAVYWPGTAGINIAFDFPVNGAEFDAVAGKSTPAGIIDRIEKTFPGFRKELWDDASAALAASYLLTTERPDLLLVRFTEVNSEQADTGALSIYARELLENDDDLVGQMLSKAPPGTIVAIVSDHGFENDNYAIRPRVLLRQAGIPGRVEVAEGLIGTFDPAIAEFLRKQVGQGRKSGIAREVPMAEVRAKAPVLGRWIAAFDTLPNFVANDQDRGPGVGPGTHLGIHGLWPTRPGYRSVFVIAGEGIRAVKLGEIDLLQIAPTLADVLGVKLAAAKYTSLWRGISQ